MVYMEDGYVQKEQRAVGEGIRPGRERSQRRILDWKIEGSVKNNKIVSLQKKHRSELSSYIIMLMMFKERYTHKFEANARRKGGGRTTRKLREKSEAFIGLPIHVISHHRGSQ